MEEPSKEERILAKPPSNYLTSVMNHIKCAIGSGIFTLGYHFQNAGMAVGPPILICVALIQLHCQHLLIQSAKMVQAAAPDETIKPDFGETGKGCFLYSAEPVRKYANAAKIFANVMLNITQMGVCCIYIVFFAESMKRVSEMHDFNLSLQMWVLIGFGPIWITSCSLLNLKFIGFLSMCGNLFLIVGMIMALYLTIDEIPKERVFNWVGHLINLPMFICTGIFAFTNIMVVLPIYIEIKKPHQVDMLFGVLNVGTFIEVSLTVMVGVLSYAAYGDNCRGSITLNFEGTVVGQIVVIFIGVSVMLSYALNMYVAIESMFPLILHKWGPFKRPLLLRLVFQTGVILGTFVVAWTVPLLELIVGLFGALGNTSLSVFMPAFFHYVISYPTAKTWVLVKDMMIIIFGVAALIAGVTSATIKIVTTLMDKNSTAY